MQLNSQKIKWLVVDYLNIKEMVMPQEFQGLDAEFWDINKAAEMLKASDRVIEQLQKDLGL
jgi:hypothetical protein